MPVGECPGGPLSEVEVAALAARFDAVLARAKAKAVERINGKR